MTTRPSSLQLHVPGHEERKISWLELFYDLIYVATIIQLGNMLVGDPTARGALLFVFLFVPVWWSWTGLMFFFNRFVVDDVWHRVLVFAQMFAIANMAISVTGAFADTSVAFALSYFAVRALLVVFYARAWLHVPNARALIRRYAVGFSVAGLCWLASALVPDPYRYGLWAVGLALEFYVPLSAASRRLQHLLPPDTSHLAERYGLFTIIVLGESFIKVVGGLADHGVTLDTLVLSGLGFVVAACVWWLYFGGVHGAVVQATTRARYLWIYAHLPLTVGITGIGVGLKKLTVLALGDPAPDSVRWLLGGAVGLCLLAFVVLDSAKAGWERAAGRETAAKVVAAAALLALAALGGGASALIVALLVATACIAQILVGELGGGSDRAGATGQTLSAERPR
jgi:low temperature requirement protein LtrA